VTARRDGACVPVGCRRRRPVQSFQATGGEAIDAASPGLHRDSEDGRASWRPLGVETICCDVCRARQLLAGSPWMITGWPPRGPTPAAAKRGRPPRACVAGVFTLRFSEEPKDLGRARRWRSQVCCVCKKEKKNREAGALGLIFFGLLVKVSRSWIPCKRVRPRACE
jgi:hypothetical protein